MEIGVTLMAVHIIEHLLYYVPNAVRFTVTKPSQFQEKGITLPLPTLDTDRPHFIAKGCEVLQGLVAGHGPTVGRQDWNSD